VTLGRFPEMTIEQARRKAAEINAAIEGGANPAQAKRAHKAQLTFADLFADYIERHAKPNKKTWEEDLDKYERHIAGTLGRKPLSMITWGTWRLFMLQSRGLARGPRPIGYWR
jgi:hypothetical protein